MKTVLFVRRYKRIAGGHVKVRDYFRHCQAHPSLDPYIFFAPDSSYRNDALWNDIPAHKIVKECRPSAYDLLFVAGLDWEILPELKGRRVINLVQHVRHGDPQDPRFLFLAQRASRICVSRQVLEAIQSHARGETIVINNGLPLDLFRTELEKHDTVLIWAIKNPGFGAELAKELQGLDVRLVTHRLPREELARQMRESDLLVSLPNRTEGFYLPALEAMAARCVVVCSDAVGNRDFCIDGETCLMPAYGDLQGHVVAIRRLFAEQELREKIRRNGFAMAQSYSLEAEREAFYSFLKEVVFRAETEAPAR